MKKKKIIIFLPDLNYGGGEKISISLANKFNEKAIKVEFVLQNYSGNYLREVEKKFKIRILSNSFLKSLFKLFLLLLTNRYDAIISNYFSLNIIASIAGFFSFTKVIICEHSPPSAPPLLI